MRDETSVGVSAEDCGYSDEEEAEECVVGSGARARARTWRGSERERHGCCVY